MKRIVYYIALFSVISNVCHAQLKLKKPLKKNTQTVTDDAQNNSASGILGQNATESEIGDALKEVLSIAAQTASSKASVFNGFFGNAEIKIFFPPEAKAMEKKLRKIGLGKQVDEAILAMNRAAEEACIESAPVFANLITKMTINDAVTILNGPSNSATMYMEKTTRPDLTVTFLPIVKRALVNANLTKYWTPLVTRYNKIPRTKNVNTDIEAYVTQKALDGLFKLMSAEEAKIRQNPAADTSDLIKKVFVTK